MNFDSFSFVGRNESYLFLDQSKIFLLSKNKVAGKKNLSENQVRSFKLNKNKETVFFLSFLKDKIYRFTVGIQLLKYTFKNHSI